EINARYGLFEPIPGTASPASWEHMDTDHYSAAYYTYIWSQTIAKDLHTAFDGDLMNTTVSRRYRDKILAPGGTKPAADLVQGFLGRPYDLRAFKEWVGGRYRARGGGRPGGSLPRRGGQDGRARSRW